MTAHRPFVRLAILVSVLGLSASLAAVGPARAGQGPSQNCSDGATQPGGMEAPTIPTVDAFVTVGLELGPTPYAQFCFSTTPKGSGGAAVTGGWVNVWLGPNPFVDCVRDTSPMIVGVNCTITVVDTSGTPSPTLSLSVTLQDTTSVGISARLGTLDDVVCLRQTTVTTPAGNVGPVDIGVCA